LNNLEWINENIQDYLRIYKGIIFKEFLRNFEWIFFFPQFPFIKSRIYFFQWKTQWDKWNFFQWKISQKTHFQCFFFIFQRKSSLKFFLKKFFVQNIRLFFFLLNEKISLHLYVFFQLYFFFDVSDEKNQVHFSQNYSSFLFSSIKYS